MAEPLFNEHPLQDYLRRSSTSHKPNPSLFTFHIFPESGDNFEPMPGAMPDLSDPFSEECTDTDTDIDLNLWSWLPTPASRLFQVSQSRFNTPSVDVSKSGSCKLSGVTG
jgi:hypothetical protein